MADSKNLWGGRFKGKPDPGFAEFNSSFRFDRRLFEADVTASLAYARALAGAGVLTIDESTAITSALEQMLAAARANSDYFGGAVTESQGFETDDHASRACFAVCRADNGDTKWRIDKAHSDQGDGGGVVRRGGRTIVLVDG